MAPHKVPGFDAKYLDDYISAIWTYYTKPTDPAVKCNQIAVDCSELLNDDKCSQKVALKHNKIFTGYVMPANTESTTSYWVFTNKTNEKDKDFTTLKMIGKDEKGNNVGKPSSNEIFGACDSGPFHGVNHTIESVIAKNFYSAIVSGILPLKDNTAVLSRYGYFAKHTKDLYKNNTVVPPTGNNLPWFMLYAAVLHDFGQKIYAYAYDDVLNIDSTLSAPSGSTVKCTMGDISGLVIPDNDHNKTSFKAIFHIPSVDALDIQHTDKKFYRWTSAGLIDKDKKVIAKAPLTLDAKINIKYGPVDAKGNIPDTVYALDLNNPGTCAAGGVVNSGTSADGVTSFDFPAK
ncbi:MAG: hypothetical protein A2017_11645 [Lentisphaerae bacterium GWF2_44_16]|nr:MAG: hypothetical protein A2017_11645 [Lentisphaerae bacterium GWF2_44_16]